MQNLSLYATARGDRANAPDATVDIELHIARLETSLAEQRRELHTLQDELREFKLRYTNIVGSQLAELEEINRALQAAEARVLGVEIGEEYESDEIEAIAPVQRSFRKLFWSVARMFHPDHAMDAKEAARRHAIMAEASRAYREGDVESLHALLGDEDLQSYCAGGRSQDEKEDSASRLIRLKEELRTAEFGIKRIKQDGLYRLKLSVDEEAKQGRDALAAQAENIKRQIVKARRRLEHFAD